MLEVFILLLVCKLVEEGFSFVDVHSKFSVHFVDFARIREGGVSPGFSQPGVSAGVWAGLSGGGKGLPGIKRKKENTLI